MRIVFSIVLVLAGFVGQGCIRPVTMVREKPPPAAAPIDTATMTAEPYDPLSLGGDVFEKELSIGEEEQRKEVYGYRVQIGAFGDKSSADKLRERAANELGVPVYVVLEEPFWCVRVGDFKAIEDAEAAKRTARTKGYGEAHVVQDKVIVGE
jgi:cell division protein FtsN